MFRAHGGEDLEQHAPRRKKANSPAYSYRLTVTTSIACDRHCIACWSSKLHNGCGRRGQLRDLAAEIMEQDRYSLLARLQTVTDARPELGVRLPRLIPCTDGQRFARDLRGAASGVCWSKSHRVVP